MTNDLRVELRVRNNRLWHVIFDSYESVSAFCRIYHLNQGHVGGFLNLSLRPYRLRPVGIPTTTARQLANIVGIPVEELFPYNLYSGTIPSKMAAEINSHRYLGLGAAKHLALPATQETELVTREALASVLKTLTPREEKILRMRFGFEESGEHTLEEVGKELNLSRGRIKQIQTNAIRKLRHPSRSRNLKGLVT